MSCRKNYPHLIYNGVLAESVPLCQSRPPFLAINMAGVVDSATTTSNPVAVWQVLDTKWPVRICECPEEIVQENATIC